MEPRRKARSFQHIMESDSYAILQKLIPKHWVIREFNRPDYGVDLVIEIFEPSKNQVNQYEALGEFLYVQVKSVQELEIKKERLYPVGHVAKGQWQEDRTKYIEAEVVRYVLDTVSLYTVEQMGASISFLLFLVDLKAQSVYFICLNDLIDKYIRPKNPECLLQGNVTLIIPERNNLSDPVVGVHTLKLYGKRGKLLSAFAKFFYQRNEILNFFQHREMPVSTYRDQIEKDGRREFSDLMDMIQTFISQIGNLDIWRMEGWPALGMSHFQLRKLIDLMIEKESKKVEILDQIMLTWHSLCNLSNIYEEIVREWFLPKNLSYFLSYPDFPNEVNNAD